MPLGNGKEFVVINQAMTASNDAGNPILHDMGGRCLFGRLTDSSAKTAELHGFCNYIDKDGDQIFEQCDFLPGAPNNCSVTGGTGKFEKLQASLVITVKFLKSNYDGIGQAVGQKKGTYKINKLMLRNPIPALRAVRPRGLPVTTTGRFRIANTRDWRQCCQTV